MRSPVKDRQKVWFSTVEEHKDGIDQWKEYGKPIMKKMTASSGTGMPRRIPASMGRC